MKGVKHASGRCGSIVVRRVSCAGDQDGEVTEMAFSAEGDHLITGTKDCGVRVWSVHSGETKVFAPPLAGINERGGYHAGHLSCDVIVDKTRGVLMAAGSATGGVNVWCSGAGTRHMAELRDSGHPYGVPVEHLAAYPDGRLFVSADSTTMKIWSTEDFKCKRTMRSPFNIQILKVSSKCRFIFCAGEGRKNRGIVALWNGRKNDKALPTKGPRRSIRVLRGHGRHIQSLYTPENEEVLVTTSLDGRAKVWDVTSGACTRTLWGKGGLQSQLSNAALVNRGAWMVMAYNDGSIQVWGLENGKCLITSDNGGPRSKCLAVSRCGRLVAFAIGKSVQVIDFDRLADRSRAGRPSEPGTYLRQALRFITAPNVFGKKSLN